MPTPRQPSNSAASRVSLIHTVVVVAGLLVGCHAARPGEPAAAAQPPSEAPPPEATPPPPRPLLSEHLLVTWYGNPRTGRMGVLGRHHGSGLAAGLRKQADAYAPLTRKRVLAAYHLVAVIAQPAAGKDGMSRRRETAETIQRMLDEARANGFKLILDVQPGHSTVKAELNHLRPFLQQPDVYLALDPEFAMPKGEPPGRKIGRMAASDVNDAIDFLDAIVREHTLPPKVLIVHQFTMNMLRDKQNIRDSPVVDVVLDVDGFGDRPLKRAMYTMVTRRPLEFTGFKLFYEEDTNLMREQDVMRLEPEPAVIIYQ